MEAQRRRTKWKTLLAFAIIYFVWGSTFLAIRVGVREVPPFLLAAMRFLVAGFVLYGWMIARGERSPSRRQWMSASLLAVLIFVLDYGLLFWAEQRVPGFYRLKVGDLEVTALFDGFGVFDPHWLNGTKPAPGAVI